MKFFLVVLTALPLIVGAKKQFMDPIHSQFEKFKKDFGKNYEDMEEEKYRLEVFKENQTGFFDNPVFGPVFLILHTSLLDTECRDSLKLLQILILLSWQILKLL